MVAAKVARMGPGGIPFPVYYEAAGLALGFFGDKVGVGAEIRDTVLVSSLALLGSRVARAGLAGKLMAGPKAWGGEGDGYANIGAGGGEGGDYDLGGVPGGGRSRVRMLPGARGGGFSVWPVSQEAPGVAG